MNLDPVAILFRVVHVLSACALIGMIYSYCFIGCHASDTGAHRKLKLTVHGTFTLFLISGIYNAVRNWTVYSSRPGGMHAMFGIHVLLGLAGLTLLMIVFAGREARPGKAAVARWALLLLVAGVAAASTLKSAREWTIAHQNGSNLALQPGRATP